MKASMFFAASSAMLALGAAVEKRAMETVWDVEWVTVTVTADQPLQTEGANKANEQDGDRRQRPEDFQVEEPEVVEPEPQPEPEVVEPEPEPEVEEPKEEPKQEESSGGDSADITGELPLGSMKQAALYSHNIHRANHSAPSLEWSDSHANYAQTLAATCVFEHDTGIGGGGYGQNLAYWGASDDTSGDALAMARATTEQWYNGELGLYHWYGYEPDMSNFLEWGHLSQLLWVDTTSVGCAVHKCPAGTLDASVATWYSVCNYYPAGNVGGGYKENVQPPGDAPMATV